MMSLAACALRAPLPPGWTYKESLTLRSSDGQANIIFSSEPVGDGVDTITYAEIQGNLLRDEFPQYEEFASEPARVSGHEGRYRRFQWVPEDGVPVTQIQVYLVVNGRGYSATATTPSVSFDDFDDLFGDVLERLSIGTGSADRE